jgi:hypothetical protein
MENSAGVFGRAGDVAACGPPISLIVTITRAEEVWRTKSRFSRPVILRVFPNNQREADIDEDL